MVSFLGVIGYVKQRAKESSYLKNEIKMEDVCLLVPFRNEEERIDILLNSIKQANSLPSEIVFIDDHSEDRTVDKIKRELSNVDHTIISLPDGMSGKKSALRYAISATESRYIHTMDADVSFRADLYEEISKLEEADMYILPAIMKPMNWKEYFYALDLYLVNGVNAGLTGIARPIIASGANLLYRRSTFHLVDNYVSHAHSASGDDTYLLRDFNLNGTFVRLMTPSNFSVFTETPHSFKSMLDQRLRWVGKTSNMKDLLSSFIGLIQFLLTITFLLLVAWNCVEQNWMMVASLVLIKSFIEMTSFYPFFRQTNMLKAWALLPIYQFYFPIYSIILMTSMLFYKPKWKERKIYGLNN